MDQICPIELLVFSALYLKAVFKSRRVTFAAVLKYRKHILSFIPAYSHLTVGGCFFFFFSVNCMGAIVFLDVLITSVYCTVFLYLQGSCIDCVLLYQSCVDFPLFVTCGRLTCFIHSQNSKFQPMQGLCIKKKNPLTFYCPSHRKCNRQHVLLQSFIYICSWSKDGQILNMTRSMSCRYSCAYS